MSIQTESESVFGINITSSIEFDKYEYADDVSIELEEYISSFTKNKKIELFVTVPYYDCPIDDSEYIIGMKIDDASEEKLMDIISTFKDSLIGTKYEKVKPKVYSVLRIY